MGKTSEQAIAEIHGVVAYRVLGPCTCSVDYTSRKLIAPDCLWHHYHKEMEEALDEAYQRGCAGIERLCAEVRTLRNKVASLKGQIEDEEEAGR